MADDFMQTEAGQEFLQNSLRYLNTSEAANETARDRTVLVLAGGSFLVSVTFLSDIAKDKDWLWVLLLSWVSLFACISALLVSYYFANSNIKHLQRRMFDLLAYDHRRPEPSQPWTGIPVALNLFSLVSLLVGMALLGAFAVLNLL